MKARVAFKFKQIFAIYNQELAKAYKVKPLCAKDLLVKGKFSPLQTLFK